MKRKIVADSSSNLFTSELENFASVPLKIIAGGREYVDDENLDVRGMLNDLNEMGGSSSTACPGTGEWMASFEDADEVFGVAITSNLSGAYNAGCVAKETFEAEHPGKKVFILDSLSTC